MLKPLAPAVNIGSRLKVLAPSPADQTMSTIESTVTTSLVKDLRPGFVVAHIEAESFSNIPENVPVTFYAVMSCSPYVLKCLRDGSPACLRNPDQEVHVLNVYGISLLEEKTCEGMEIIAPVRWDETREVAKRGDAVPAK
jgi:hypothetical protein